MHRYHRLLCLHLIALMLMLLPGCSRAENLTCNYLPGIMRDFLDNHYAMKSLDDAIATHTVDQMIKRLDTTKTLLYQSDVDKLRQDLQNMFGTIRKGNCAALSDVYGLLMKRAKENEAFVKNFLGPGYKLDETVELNTDVDKRPYPKTQAEKEELLRKFVHFQIANELLSESSLDEAKKNLIHRYELQTKRISERSPDKLVTSFAEAFALALDPHSAYLSPENMEDFRIHMQLSLEGIGAVLSTENGFTIIEEIMPGGGAERTGLLKPKDRIIAVAQERERPVNVIDMDLRDVIKMIRGKKGTKVTLTILRRGARTERFTVTIVRDKIDFKEQEAKLTYIKRRVGAKEYVFGILNLPSFYGGQKEGKSSYKDVKRLLEEAKKKKVDGIVLNLSRNGGGLLIDAVRITGLFIDRGGVVATKDAEDRINIIANGILTRISLDGMKKITNYPREDRAAIYTGPLVVLTSRLSASASEIVAGALKDYRRAVIAGADHTYGKGSVQRVEQLPLGLGGIKVTTEMFFLPGGMSTQKTGVAADIVLPGLFSNDEIGESALDYALPPQKIEPFIYTPASPSTPYPPWRPVDPDLTAKLAAKSKARVAKSEAFAEIIKTNQEAAERKGIVRIADLRKESEKENIAKADWKQLRKKSKEREIPYQEEGANILLDMILAR
jgi:carboxyl-terminal processing protease